jgi:hypothetical protein
MAQAAGASNVLRKEISYFDGVNSLVSSNMAKKEEIVHCENARSPMIGTIEKREGISVIGSDTAKTYSTNNYGLFFFNCDNVAINGGNGALYKFSENSGVNNFYYLNTSTMGWTTMAGLGAAVATPSKIISTCTAEGNLFIANENFATRYIKSDGTTVVSSATSTGNLYRCPVANLINYYKGRLYVADYTDNSGIRLKNTVLMSSTQLGILALVNNDVKKGETVIPVTDNKYFIPGETIQFYRGNTLITSGVVASVQETTITMNVKTTVDLLAADEIWVNNTFGGAGVTKVFRWVNNPSAMGVNAKDYDTFKVSGTTDNSDEAINVMTNIANYMILMTNNNIAVWNSYVLQNLDLGVGCVSRQGYVKCSGSLYFLHYTGIYETAGAMPKCISTKVEKYITGATRAGLEAASAGKKGRSIFFAIGDVTLRNPDGSIEKVLKDVCLEYNIAQENWYVYTNWKINKMVTYYASANGVATDPDVLAGISEYTISASKANPIVELLDVGTFLDVTSEIPFRIDTPNIMLGSTFQMIAYPQEVHLEMERGVGMKCFVSLDLGDWYELDGEAGKGATIFKINSKDKNTAQPPRCRNIRLSFRHFEKQLCKISKVAVLYTITPEEDPRSEDIPGYINSTQ